MIVRITGPNGHQLDAKVELSEGTIILHSRGGAFNKPNLRNPDYRAALTLILERLRAKSIEIEAVWLDSSIAREWSEKERLLIAHEETAQPVERLVALVGNRAAAKGRPAGADGQGNSTKRLKISTSPATGAQLAEWLQAVEVGSAG